MKVDKSIAVMILQIKSVQDIQIMILSKVSPLCANPNCSHNTSECTAQIVGTNPIIYNDYVYYFVSEQDVNELSSGEREFYINSELRRVSMETSEFETIVEFHDCVPDTEGGYFRDENIIYFTGTDMNLQTDAYGAIYISNIGGKQFLCSIDLESGTYVNYGSIYDGDEMYETASSSCYATIRDAYDEKIYINYSFLEEEIPDEEVIPEYNGFAYLTFEFDLASKTLSESELPSPIIADLNYYVGFGRENLKLIVIEGENRYEVECGEEVFAASVVNNKLFNKNEQKWYDLNDMSEHSMGEYSDYIVTTYYDGCYILINGYKTVKLTEEELFAL